MDKKEFTVVCREIFAHYGFLKRKNLYFRAGNNGVLCGLGLKFSQFGPTGSVMVYYYTGAQIIDTATTEAEIDKVLEVMPGIVQRMRDMSPLWEEVVKNK